MTMVKQYAFGVEAEPKIHDGQLVVVGRCHSGEVLPGSTFTSVGKSGTQVQQDAIGSIGRRDVVPLTLHVLSIYSYGMSLDLLSEGMTARLVLRGTGYDQVADKSVLVGEAESRGTAANLKEGDVVEALYRRRHSWLPLLRVRVRAMIVTLVRWLRGLPSPNLSEQQAVEIVRRACVENGWSWREPIRVTQKPMYYSVKTNVGSRGANVVIHVNLYSGKVDFTGVTPR